MDFFSTEQLPSWLQDALRYVEENIVKLPRWRATRLLLVITAYYIFRPWILKLAGVSAGLGPQKDGDHEEEDAAMLQAPNAPTDAIDVSEILNSEHKEGDGKAARRRQIPLKELLEGTDKPPAEAEPDSDKEIEDFLRRVVK